MKELLSTLPDPYREQAMFNYDHKFYLEHKEKEEPVTTARKALACAFNWSESEQGYSYWFDLHTELETKTAHV
jgi:hypothetical protein